MAQGRKYAALPDLDSAPDIYETQAPTDEDPRPASSSRSSSAASSYQDVDDAASADDTAAAAASSGIDRAALHPHTARSHFRPARVDARHVDFSDRVGGARRSYRVASRRRRVEFAGTADADEDEDETYREKLARLRREVEEVQALGDREGEEATREDRDIVARLSGVLRELEESTKKAGQTAENDAPKERTAPGPSAEELAKAAVPDMAQTERALTLAATLEARLASLETALGLPSLSLPRTTAPETASASQASEKPILATLANLDRQLTSLNNTTAPTLGALAADITALTASAESLAAARRAAATARKELRAQAGPAGGASRPLSSHSFSTSRPASYSQPPANAAADGALPDAAAALLAAEDGEQAARIARLYAALPAVDALAPLVPAVLDRLASLKVLHEGAAGAAEALAELEAGQARTAADVREWRAALAELESRIAESADGDARNRDVVQGWVRDLEGRLDKLRA